ncbi:MAG TPA: VOC family protein [Anaerolineae bacterium]|nr:VOC family protein [Anaerolineae bacterium]HMR67237.1 VOC family protein [Anaerolineae bacterium]
MLRGLTTVSFWAADLEAAKQWYTELLGHAPYFERPGPDGKPAYIEFRLGDYQHELGIIDSNFAPQGAAGPGGAVVYWHVDDVAKALEKAKALGATDYQPLTQWGEAGFTTASVLDPFGNILGLMYNPHYLDILNSIRA